MLNSITTFFKLANPGLFFIYFRSSFQTNIITIFTTNKCEKCSSSIRDSNPRPSEREPTFNLLARLQLEFLKVSKSLNWVNNNDLNSFLESFFNPNFFWELIFSHSLSLSLTGWTFDFWKLGLTIKLIHFNFEKWDKNKQRNSIRQKCKERKEGNVVSRVTRISPFWRNFKNLG